MTLVNFFTILLVIVSLFLSANGQDKCEIEKCPEYGSTETEHVLTLLPVPWNCSQYIMCDRGSQYIRPCPPGLHFIPTLQVCEFPDRATCIESCSKPSVNLFDNSQRSENYDVTQHIA